MNKLVIEKEKEDGKEEGASDGEQIGEPPTTRLFKGSTKWYEKNIASQNPMHTCDIDYKRLEPLLNIPLFTFAKNVLLLSKAGGI